MAETYVLDCSLAAKWILPEPGRPAALRVFERYVSGEVSLIAPDLLLVEFASLLAKRRRRKQLSTEQAREAFQLMNRSAPPLFDMRSRLSRAFELALSYEMSLWDSVYLALALEYDCPVLTADRRLFRTAGKWHSSLRLIE